MTDVFFSYKRDDEDRVVKLVRALEEAGLTVWWDRGLPGGESWRANIQGALEKANCVVVAWTKMSVGPTGDFVRDEAGEAKLRGILVPVILESGVRPPLGFGEIQAIDLAHWRGKLNDPYFQDLVAAIRAKLEGSSAPLARGHRARMLKRLTIGSLVSTLSAGLFAFSMNLMGIQNYSCTIPLGQPSTGDFCGMLGIGNQPNRQERVEFEALLPGDCTALESYRNRHEKSSFRPIVDSRLNARVRTEEVNWVSNERQLTLFVGSAREGDVRPQAKKRAEQLCRGFAASTQFKFQSAKISGSTSCEEGLCSFSGDAICELQERQISVKETCGSRQ
jgi:hypothetical protein